MKHPVGREMLADAEYDEEDMHWRQESRLLQHHLCRRRLRAGRRRRRVHGSVLQPGHGLDFLHHQQRRGPDHGAAPGRADGGAHRAAQPRLSPSAIARWFEAIYKDKYEYMGEFDLMSLAFRLDLGLYYLGIVSQPFKYGAKALLSRRFLSPFRARFPSHADLQSPLRANRPPPAPEECAWRTATARNAASFPGSR